jgi:hypothetical protein
MKRTLPVVVLTMCCAALIATLLATQHRMGVSSSRPSVFTLQHFMDGSQQSPVPRLIADGNPPPPPWLVADGNPPPPPWLVADGNPPPPPGLVTDGNPPPPPWLVGGLGVSS